ncbi:MAG: ABC transporter ATP-binding protein [Microvirga sp.]
MASQTEETLLDIRNLGVAFRTESGDLPAVRDVSFALGRERLAIVGESGSGKSTIMRALLGLLPANATVTAERARFTAEDGQVDLLKLGPNGLRRIRGRQIAMVVQDPKQGLNPSQRIGRQVEEMIRLHRPTIRRSELRDRAVEALADVHIHRPGTVIDLLPHQVSGGMAQRVMIAMMLAGSPKVLIADEATSALDAVVQHRILELIETKVRQLGMGLILISHDLDLVGRYADRILVMYRGRVLERLEGVDPLSGAAHPYTKGLLACRPKAGDFGQFLPTLERDPAWLR